MNDTAKSAAKSAVNATAKPPTPAAGNSAIDIELKRLEQRVDELVTAVAHLKDENRALHQRQDTLTAERATLLQKNEQVRTRVEAMIGRLKAMEHTA